ncbi:SAM-dependent methyltransferase [Polymorphobacter multimanifer]|uniref:SAM-dependent methyltransferase n=1 Tax=Polymorphobacter multimanifer TaxID=1070431 RepID=A0A841L0Q9_9SPHN|nr:class I SAM-dependent methyltransferase [Polymorphobacter multimanifer]MBB6225990.1 SAM-dependent methyltransferase [Polymorphobacter multimanifer]
MNEAMRDYWNADAGHTWAEMQARLDLSLSPVTAALLSLAAPMVGDRVLDIGCGSGETALALATVVGEGGDVLGVDISRPLLEVAEARAEALDSDAQFIEADAATLAGQGDRDLVISRFGVMFFDDPAAAFANIRTHARPEGRLRFACWRTPADNGWAGVPLKAVVPLLPPSAPADPLAPGPFAFADPDRLVGILETAGWQDIDLQRFDFDMLLGQGDDPLAAAIEFSMRVGPAARVVREGDAGVRAAAEAALRAAYAPYAADGRVALPGSVWLVSAHA